MERNYNSLVVTGTWIKADDVEVKLASVIFSVMYDNKYRHCTIRGSAQVIICSAKFSK